MPVYIIKKNTVCSEVKLQIKIIDPLKGEKSLSDKSTKMFQTDFKVLISTKWGKTSNYLSLH